MSRADDAADWARLRVAFDEIVAHDDARRAAMLAEIGDSDAAMRAKLERLLEADASSEDQLARLDRLFDQGASKPDPLGLVGRTVGHFQVIAPLATGGMGVVYRALDTNLGRAVALKFPLPHRQPDRQIAERFRREARAAAALDHPNVCSVYEAGQTDDGQLFLAMAFYDGETLKDRLAREGSLPIQDAVNIGAQIARGLGAAHRAGIAHRDLKPANVMLLPDGGVKILDFGVARMMDAALTTTRGTPGTIAYMAPESVRGDGSDARSDLWALGVLLYEALAGERPFEHQHEVALMHAILNNQPVRPSLFRQGIDPKLEQLILSLLAKDPGGRPECADRVLDVLASLHLTQSGDATPVNGTPVNATPAAPPRRRARLTAALVAAIVVLLVGVSSWYTQRVTRRETGPLIVAVLPFQAADADPDTPGVGAALANEIANRLARLTSVAVPDRQFVQMYSNAGSDAERLRGIPAADAVVTGTIERSGGGLEIEIELRGARGRTSKQGYTFAHSELHTALPVLAREIAASIRLDLTREERRVLAALPTISPEAWELYLRARAIQMQLAPPVTTALEHAQRDYAKARELDQDFALAHARLAEVHRLISLTYDTTSNRLSQVRYDAEAALRVDPGLPEAHTALASYYRGQGDTVRADSQFQLAIASAPNRSDLRLTNASRMRDLGQWKEAVTEFQNAIRLDPRNTLLLGEAATTYSRLRRYEDGIAAWDRVLALDSGNVLAKALRGHQYLRLGIIDSLAATVERLPPESWMATYSRYTVLRVQRRHVDLLAMLDNTRHTTVGDVAFYRPIILLRAMTLDAMGQPARARPVYEAAQAMLEDSIRAHPSDARMHIALGLAYAGIGRKARAIAHAQRAMDLTPLSSSSMRATAFMGDAVQVFIKVGEYDKAIGLIGLLLSMHAGREISVPLLILDPMFDPLRGDPRFERLLVQYSRPRAL